MLCLGYACMGWLCNSPYVCMYLKIFLIKPCTDFGNRSRHRGPGFFHWASPSLPDGGPSGSREMGSVSQAQTRRVSCTAVCHDVCCADEVGSVAAFGDAGLSLTL